MIKSTKVTFIILLFSLFSSCNSVKTLHDDDFLLVKNKVIVNDKQISNLDILSYINQRPNQKVLGMPFSLYVYNWAKKDFEKTAEKWANNHPNNSQFIHTFFSDKQIEEVYLFNKKINNILKKSGEPPVIIDDKKTKKSVSTLKKHYYNKGFFDAEISYKEIEKKGQRKEIAYYIKTNKPYIINDYDIAIESPVLKEIYNKHKRQSFVKRGKQFDRSNFVKEQKRLTNLFRNSGIYFFRKNYISFGGLIKDTVAKIKKVKLIIKERSLDKKDLFQVRKVTQIKIYTDYLFSKKNKKHTDSVQYKGLSFYSYNKLNVNPKRLSNAISITLNGVYKDDERKLTVKSLTDLKIFESPINIIYTENTNGNLTAKIYLTPLKKYGVDAKADITHSSIKPFGVLGKFGIIDRNIFNGLEILEISTQFSFLNVAEDTSDPQFNYFGLNAWEFGANMSFKIPRIFFPVNTNKLIPKRMHPSTHIGTSISFQKNIGLDRQNITGNFSYSWRKGQKVKHQLDVFNIQYINNINSSNYFEVFNSEKIKLSHVAQDIIDPNNMNSDGEITNISGYINHVLHPANNYATTDFENYKIVQRVAERKNIITEDVLVPITSYSYTYNGKSNSNDTHFSFVNARIVSAGAIATALTKQETDDKKELFGLPIAQYVKAEIEYKKYWNLYNHHHLVFRTFIGAALPFGNSTEIPFSRSYRAGGSNDIRAWKTFNLGPGSSLSNLDFNIGNLKLVSNFEYRFKVINSFYGALFIDAGNVWDMTNSELTEVSSKFKGFSSLKEIAVGSGVGLRYDFDFLIFRTDFAFKTYEPYLKSKGWFKSYNLKNMVFNFGINYPF